MAITNEKLHIDELKNKFKSYRQITVADFNEFYNEVFGKIKRNTVSWYIYELKKTGVIRNVSRGQYVLFDVEIYNGSEYIVITMDIVESSKMGYAQFEEELHEKISLLNKVIERIYGIKRKYYISRGDEIQILFPFNKSFGEIMLLTLSYLYPFEIRYGLSIETIDTEIKQNSWDMNGPIFWNARDQLEKIKKASSYEGLIMSGYSNTDRICNRILPLINKSFSKITKKQWIAIKYELSKESLEESIDIIGISKTSYYDRLNVSNISEILSSFVAIYDLMEMRRKIN